MPADLFVGRDSELAAVSGLLGAQRGRLLTLTGPPGIGKTRLAVACAAAYSRRGGGEAVFVDLAPVRDPDRVVVELARALGVGSRGGADIVSQLEMAAGDRELLAVVDNCEHLLAAAPGLARVLDACKRLFVLATSRERLRLSCEREFPVPPLAMPVPGGAADLDSLAANPSVALLVDRARRINPGFALTAANASSVVSACIRLEGLPLALELAAARLKILTAGELAFRLGNRMDLLSGSARDVPVRQRALRSAITWSHDLLNSAERGLFRQLSVFVGRWTLADAESVCAGATDDMLGLVGSLLDKSLIRRAPHDDGKAAEFSMLESLREYAAEQLAAHGETDRMRTRHANHYARLAVQFEEAMGLPAERVWWSRIGRHYEDLCAALEYSLSTGQRVPALQIAAAIGWYSYTRGDFGDGHALVDRVLWPGDGRGPGAAGELAVHDGTGAGPAEAAALVAGGIVAWGRGQPDRAVVALRMALELSERVDDVRRGSIAAAFLGHVARSRGRYEESGRWHHRAEAGFQFLGNVSGVAWARHDLGLLARDRGDLSQAVRLLRASLRDFRELDYPWAVAWSAWGLGTTLCAQGRARQAGPLLGEAVRMYQEVSDPRGVAQCLEALAHVACEQASYEAAARLVGAAAAHRVRLGAPSAQADAARTSAVMDVLARALGPDTAEHIRQAGRTMPAEQAVTLAVSVARGQAPGDPDRGDGAPLTRREQQVAVLVASGRTNRQIGRALGISEKTAEVHLQHVMAKLGVRGRAAVAAWAATGRAHAPATDGATRRPSG